MNDESRQLIDHLRNVAQTSTKEYEVITPATLGFLVRQIDNLEEQIKELNSSVALLLQLKDDGIVLDMGDIAVELEKAESKANAYRAELDAVPVEAIRFYWFNHYATSMGYDTPQYYQAKQLIDQWIKGVKP